MDELEKREKVIKGLECCAIDGGCGACPYDSFKDCPGSHPTPETLMKDALALLKAQEPRLVTPADYENNPDVDSEGYLPLWVEYRRDGDWGEFWEDQADEWCIVIAKAIKMHKSDRRFWTARPTDEQRKAVNWE